MSAPQSAAIVHCLWQAHGPVGCTPEKMAQVRDTHKQNITTSRRKCLRLLAQQAELRDGKLPRLG